MLGFGRNVSGHGGQDVVGERRIEKCPTIFNRGCGRDGPSRPLGVDPARIAVAGEPSTGLTIGHAELLAWR
jgi:hypothetical protein